MISSILYNFFVNVGHTSAMSIQPPCNNTNRLFIILQCCHYFNFDPFTENEIRKIGDAFKDNAAGWDDMMVNVIWHTKEIYVILWNISVTFRFCWVFLLINSKQIPKVVPIHKADNDMVFSTYRRASILNVLQAAGTTDMKPPHHIF